MSEKTEQDGPAELDWSTAQVKDGKLIVELTRKPDAAWEERFVATATLLNHDDWEGVKLKKRQVQVNAVQPGEEDRLRTFLEGAVLQANAAGEAQDEDEDDRPGESGGDANGPDAEMTERFRSYSD